MGRKFLLAVLAAALFAPGVFAQADLSATVPYRNMITDFTVVKKETAALLVIDAQNDLASPNNAAVSASIAQAVGMFRKAGRPIIHVVRLYDAAGSNADLFIRTQLQNGLKFLQPGMPGSEFIPGTVPPGTKLNFDILMRGGVQTISDIEFAIYKPRLNPFTRTNLDQFLKSQNTNA
ncbi:MAG: isochorismatase family protein, partial [Elusimicrobiaceae bacterium]